MYRLRLGSCLLLGAALLVGCSDHDTPTAPSVGPLATTASVLADRPYTWSVKCSGSAWSEASWSWTAAGAPIAGTQMTVFCDPSNPRTDPVSGSGTRPANADGFTASVNGTSQAWTFEPAAPFALELKGSSDWTACYPGFPQRKGHCSQLHATATLSVAS
jgi:hypothetical protein